jgi:hypothetical protein
MALPGDTVIMIANPAFSALYANFTAVSAGLSGGSICSTAILTLAGNLKLSR